MKRRIIKNTSVATADFSGGLVRYFKFNSSMSDEIIPQSLSSGSGSTYGTGKVGDSRVLNGSSDYAVYGGTSDFNMSNAELNDIPFSFSVWLKVDSTGGSEGRVLIVAQETSSLQQWRVTKNFSSIVFTLFSKSNISGGDTKSVSIPISMDVWALYTFTYDATISGTSGMAAYKNGVLVEDTAIVVNSYTGMRDITPNYAIGRRTTQTIGYFKGEIDELAVWKNRVLTAWEVSQLNIKGNSGISIV